MLYISNITNLNEIMKSKSVLDFEYENLVSILGIMEKLNQTLIKIVEKKDEINLDQSTAMMAFLTSEVKSLALFLKKS